MSKFLRKITAVVLAVLLVSLCGINAFAAGQSYSVSEDYDDDRYVVGASASIDKYYTQGSIWIQDMDNSCMLTTQYRYVSVSYNYLVLVDENAVQKSVSTSDTASSGDYNASVSYYNSNIYNMVSAIYTFEADIPCSYGTQEFRPATVTLIYYP